MPRCARIRILDGIYHVIIKSISEIILFRDSKDKEMYLLKLKKYQDIFMFKVYGFCLMSNHAHFIVDSNGADISSFMKSVNQSYAAYYNSRYNRHGHLFQDRFKSKVVSDYKYLINLSLYIHNNPKDMREFSNSIEKYRFSSLGVYLGIRKDKHNILDLSFILGKLDVNTKLSMKAYGRLIFKDKDKELKIIEDGELLNLASEYKSGRKILLRNLDVAKIYNLLSVQIEKTFNPNVKFNHKNIEVKSICVVLMRSLCNLKLKEICDIIGNVTLSNIWRLCEKGLELISSNPKYRELVDSLILQGQVAV